MDFSFLKDNRLIPVVVLNSADETLPKLNALKRGGIRVAEITFRTACAEECLRIAANGADGMLIGAGTVINAAQCERAIEAGAKFVVSPGLSKAVFDVCQKHDVPYIPGVVTPTEIMAAEELGLDVLKFFPAGAFGGVKTIKALSGPFPNVKFVPTGGVDAGNLKQYLALKSVVAVGGSWMMKGDVDEIEKLSREATDLMAAEE